MTVLGIHAQTVQDSIFTVNGVSFKMVYVEGGSFEMGTNNSEEDEAPAHDVALSSYMIGETEVTQELWQMVMGNNPSRFKGEVHRPVEQVSWEDCQKFVAKLNDLTGKRFRLPTEAEWEFAARGGIKSKGYMYSGSNTLNDVAWYNNNAHKVGEYSSDYGIHPVGTKLANELGLYDMSGNVLEWCQDWYDYNYYSRSPRFNPCGPVSGSLRIARGGCWFSQDEDNSVSKRTGFLPAFRYYHFGIRLVMALNDSVTDKTDFQIEKPFELNRTFNIDSVSFKMIYVEGGSFMMGDTIPNYDKYPHLVSLDSYMIGETEVTQELWEVVMDSRRPVDTVSWEDCQGFINKLNDLTGEHFRLPTEAEWEFAARGGVNSRGYKYSGSNTLRNVAWYNDNAGWIVGKNTPNYGTHPVGMKSPNELGIYDMSGNVAEWCQDWYNSLYYLCLPVNIPINNPMGPYRGSERVLRGGSWIDLEDNMRNNKLVVYERNSNVPDLQLLIYGDGEERQCLGLRLVLDIGRSERSTILPEDNPDFIREGVTSIKYGAYSGQEELTSITIPKSVNCIE